MPCLDPPNFVESPISYSGSSSTAMDPNVEQDMLNVVAALLSLEESTTSLPTHHENDVDLEQNSPLRDPKGADSIDAIPQGDAIQRQSAPRKKSAPFLRNISHLFKSSSRMLTGSSTVTGNIVSLPGVPSTMDPTTARPGKSQRGISLDEAFNTTRTEEDAEDNSLSRGSTDVQFVTASRLATPQRITSLAPFEGDPNENDVGYEDENEEEVHAEVLHVLVQFRRRYTYN
jgi:hypothetical protein